MVALAAARHQARPRAPPASTVRGAFHIHSDRSDGSGSVDAIAAAAARAGLQFIILTDHGDGTRAPDAPAYRSGVLTIDGVELNTTSGHYAAIGLPASPYPIAGHAGRCDRGRASAWRIRYCRASRLAAAVTELAGVGRAVRRARVDQRRQRMARRAAHADRARVADVSGARAAVAGDGCSIGRTACWTVGTRSRRVERWSASPAPMRMRGWDSGSAPIPTRRRFTCRCRATRRRSAPSRITSCSMRHCPATPPADARVADRRDSRRPCLQRDRRAGLAGQPVVHAPSSGSRSRRSAMTLAIDGDVSLRASANAPPGTTLVLLRNGAARPRSHRRPARDERRHGAAVPIASRRTRPARPAVRRCRGSCRIRFMSVSTEPARSADGDRGAGLADSGADR